MRFSKRVELIRRLLTSGAKLKLLHALEKLGPTQSSFIFRDLKDHERPLFFDALLEFPFLEKILGELPAEIFPKVFASFSLDQQTQFLSKLSSDHAWSYLQGLELEEQERFGKKFPPEVWKKIEKISQFPAGSCGEIMQTEFTCVKDTATIAEVIQAVRQADPKQKIFYLYVVDEAGHLLGTVPLRSLLKEDQATPISQVMVTTHVSAQALETQEQAAKLVSQYKLLAIPVVDEAHHLLGVIRVDDVIEIVQEEAAEDMYRMAGLSPEDRILSPWRKTMQKRLVWMSINLVTAFLAAWVVGLFKDSIEKVVALAIYMPVVAGMGGNSGVQSLTVMTRALALGEIGGREVWRALFKEVWVGCLVGLITGFVTGLVAWGWQGSFYLGGVLWMAMVINMVIAGFAGSMIPIVLRLFKADPALGSGVLVTTFTDVFGFLSFLGLATLFLKFLV